MHARRRNEKSKRARTASLTLVLALLITPELFATDFGVDTTRAPLASISAVVQEFLAQRAQIEPIYPYDLCQFIHPVDAPVLASPGDFPTAFRNGLIGVGRSGCTVYPVTCIQVRGLDSIVFVNADGSVFGALPYTDDSTWNRTAWSDDDYLRWEDPARVGITLYLVTADDLAAAAAAAELQAELNTTGGGFSRLDGRQNLYNMQNLLDATYTNLIIAGVQKVSNGVELTIGLPADWTNRLDVLVSDDLVPLFWRWRATLDDATNGLSFSWVDTNAPAIDRTFVVLGNADIDGDGDGLSDATELYVTKTSPTNSDTDGDGFNDYDEIMTSRTDPNNPDVTKPTVTMDCPTNNYTWIWMP